MTTCDHLTHCEHCSKKAARKQYLRAFKHLQRVRWRKEGRCITCGRSKPRDRATCEGCSAKALANKRPPTHHHWKAAPGKDGKRGYVRCTFCETQALRGKLPSEPCPQRLQPA